MDEGGRQEGRPTSWEEMGWESSGDLGKGGAAEQEAGGGRLVSGGPRRPMAPESCRSGPSPWGRAVAVPTGTGGAIGTRGTFCLSCRHRDLSP